MQEYASAGKVLSMFEFLNGCTFYTKLWAFSPLPPLSYTLKACTSRLCMKMLSFMYARACAMPRHDIHHVEFYFQFVHLISFPV